MATENKSRGPLVTPRSWTIERVRKISAVEGLSLTPRMERVVVGGGMDARRKVLAESKRR